MVATLCLSTLLTLPYHKNVIHEGYVRNGAYNCSAK